jgi:Zn finger protein HypA/HybF involved in hydrogenase expression
MMTKQHSTGKTPGTTSSLAALPKEPQDWACQECGRKMTLEQAQRAVLKGCPKCDGTDVDANGGCHHA